MKDLFIENEEDLIYVLNSTKDLYIHEFKDCITLSNDYCLYYIKNGNERLKKILYKYYFENKDEYITDDLIDFFISTYKKLKIYEEESVKIKILDIMLEEFMNFTNYEKILVWERLYDMINYLRLHKD